MTQIHPGRPQRQLGKMAAVVVAIIATGSAYLAMVDFAIDVIGMLPGVAYTTAGVFELSLITVALLAMEAAQQNRPNGTLLTLTWLLSSASGVFAAWHELYLGHPLGGALWRLIVPLLAATMWHLALIGDRHLASGRTWSSMRENARMHALFLTTDALRRAINTNDGSRAARRRVARAQKRRLRARAVALRTVQPTDMRRQTAIWSEALAAADELTSEVVALADEDASRMTIRADLSPRLDRLAVTVDDHDGDADQLTAESPTVKVLQVVEAPQEVPQTEALVDVDVAVRSSAPDAYAERAEAAVEAELSTITRETAEVTSDLAPVDTDNATVEAGGVTATSRVSSPDADPRQITPAELEAVAAAVAAATAATEGLSQQERQRAVRRAQGPQVRAWRNRGVTVATIAAALEAGQRTVFRIINGDYDTDTSGEGIPAVDATDKAADQYLVGQGDLVTAR